MAIPLKCVSDWLIRTYSCDITQHNSVDYRFKRGSCSTLYSERFSPVAKYHNKFFDYIRLLYTTSSCSPRWTNEIKSPLALTVFSKSPKAVLEFIRILYNSGIRVDINAKDLFGLSALEYAIASGQEEMVKVLVQEAPQVHIYGKDKALYLPALLDQAICFGNKEIVKVFANLKYDGKRADEHGNGFRNAVIHNKENIAKYLIKNNLIEDWNQGDQYGQTALMHVAYCGHPGWNDILSTLLQKGADIKVKDIDGRNVLMHLLIRYRYLYEYCTNYTPDGIHQLLNDKNEMLRVLCNHVDILQIIHNKDNKKKTTLAYFTELLSVMPEVDQEEIINILFDAKLYDIADSLYLG